MNLHTQFRFTSVAFTIALFAIGRVILLPSQVELSRPCMITAAPKSHAALKTMPVAAPAGEPAALFQMLQGTGIYSGNSLEYVKAAVRGSVKVQDVSEQSKWAGLQQSRPHQDRNFAGLGETNVALLVDGKAAKPIKVSFR